MASIWPRRPGPRTTLGEGEAFGEVALTIGGGRRHAAWTDRIGLRYATDAGGAWSTTTVVSNEAAASLASCASERNDAARVGPSPSLAIAPGGQPILGLSLAWPESFPAWRSIAAVAYGPRP